MKKIILSAFLSLALFCGHAQNDEAGVRACLENYMSGVPDRVEKAFHPSATMKFVDYKTGEFKDVPIAEYLQRVKTNYTGSPSGRSIEIVSVNTEGTAAQAKIRIETNEVFMYDYMNLLKLGGEWKIVSKIFHRQDRSTK